LILIWDLAYIAVAKQFENVKWLVGVFFVEKFIYGCRWIDWIANNTLSSVFEKDKMAGLSMPHTVLMTGYFYLLYLNFIKLVAELIIKLR
jgi:hypothetical protein